jgi:hypothetical protein
LFLTHCKIGKQNKQYGKAAATKYAFSKENKSRMLEVAVRKVLQKDWTFHRPLKYYKVL